MLRPCRSHLRICSTDAETLSAALRSQADAVVLDLSAPTRRQPAAIREILRRSPRTARLRAVRVEFAELPELLGELPALIAAPPAGIGLVIVSSIHEAGQVTECAALLREGTPADRSVALDAEVDRTVEPAMIGRIASALGHGRGLHLTGADHDGGTEAPGGADLYGIRLIDATRHGPATRPVGYFHGRWIDDPDDAPSCNAAFTPTAEQVGQARRVLDACAAAGQDCLPAVILDGRPLHLRTIRWAERVATLAGVLGASVAP
jgi:citrate lyase beta subunit